MKKIRAILYAGMMGILLGCSAEEPSPRTPVDMWDLFWTDLRITYPFFALDKVDWDATNARIRPQLSAATQDTTLFRLMSEAMTPLLDGHASLRTPTGKLWAHPERNHGYSGFSPSLVIRSYLRQDTTGYRTELIQAGTLAPGIRYIWVRTFAEAGVAALVDSALHAGQGEVTGLVLDVRSNGGGLISESEALAGIFQTGNHAWGMQKIKNGPGRDDFTSLETLVVGQGRLRHFSGKVALLTNRYSASASERLRLMTRGLPTVVGIGDTTYGATSPILERTLPNGWKYVSVGSVTYDREGITYERIGVPPDQVVRNTKEEIQAGRDRALEAGLAAVR